MTTTATNEAVGKARGRRFLRNVLWTWAGVAVNVAVAALLSPYIIRTLGEAQFSVWTLSLSFIEYFWLIDIGLRAATVKFSAHYRAAGDLVELRRLFNTGLFYSTAAGILMAGLSLLVSGRVAAFFRITDPAFPFLLSVVGVSWAFGMSMSIMSALLEGHQRFDVISRIWITGLVVRSAGTALLVYTGHGLYQIGFMMLGTQILMSLLTWIAIRSLVPDVPVSLGQAAFPVLRRMASYGAHSLKVLVSTRLLGQSTPFLIAYFLPLPNVAYYTVPLRILEYVFDAIGRIGMVTMPNAAELLAEGNTDAIAKLSVLANRYSLTLFLPLTVFLTLYPYELYARWIRPEFAANSAYLVPVMLVGYTIAAGQHNSISVLFGIARHQMYSTLQLGEALLNIAGMVLVLPRYGLIGAVWVVASLMILNRGLLVCLLLSRELKLNPLRYATSIYLGPGSAAGLTLFVCWLMKSRIPGDTWFSLGLAGLLMTAVYAPLAFAFALTPEHRRMIVSRAQALVASRRA